MAIKRKKTPTPCSIPDCWQPARCAGMCSACYSWWHRVSIYSAGELTEYLRRVKRMGNRAGVFGTQAHRTKLRRVS